MKTMNESWETIEQAPGMAASGRRMSGGCARWRRLALAAGAVMVLGAGGLMIARVAFGWEGGGGSEGAQEFVVLLGAITAAMSGSEGGCCFRRKKSAVHATGAPGATGGTE